MDKKIPTWREMRKPPHGHHGTKGRGKKADSAKGEPRFFLGHQVLSGNFREMPLHR